MFCYEHSCMSFSLVCLPSMVPQWCLWFSRITPRPAQCLYMSVKFLRSMWWHKNYSSSSWVCVSSHWKVNLGWELECPLKASRTVSGTQKISYLFCDWFCTSWKLGDLVQLTIYLVPSWVETLCRIWRKQWWNELTSVATGLRGFTRVISLPCLEAKRSMFKEEAVH